MPILVYSLLTVELIIVAWGDIRFKRIPNLWSIFNIILFLIFSFVYSDFYKFAFEHFFFSLAFFFVGFFLFILKIMGGGDSKFLASLFLLIPATKHILFFRVLLYLTVLVGAGLLTYNTVKNFRELWLKVMTKDFSSIKEIYGSKFTYAPLILVSWIVFGYINFYDKDLLKFME